MQSKLDQNQIKKISDKYHDHPLLVACRETFEGYEAETQRLLFAPEEMFLETAIILDEILTAPEDAMQYIDGLWNSLRNKIRHLTPEAPPEDAKMISGAIFYVVATVLCQHSQRFFNEDLKDKILDTARGNLLTQDGEEQRVILALSHCAEGLCDWLTEYVDSNERLSEQIMEAIQETKPPVKRVKISKTPQNANTQLITQTFEYNKNGQDSVKNRRLCSVYSKLKAQKLIARESDQKQFLEIFYGCQSHNKIAWTGNLNMLHYLFDEWVTKREYVTRPKGVGIWQLVAAHFYLEKKKGDKIETIILTANDVKDVKKPKNVTDDIETIIEMLNPNFGIGIR